MQDITKKIEEAGIKLIIYQPKRENRVESFWYGRSVATLEKDGRTLTIDAIGDIRVNFEENGICYKDRGAVEEAEHRGYTDHDINGEDVYWHFNNWFELYLEADYTERSKEEFLSNVELWEENMKEWIRLNSLPLRV